MPEAHQVERRGKDEAQPLPDAHHAAEEGTEGARDEEISAPTFGHGRGELGGGKGHEQGDDGPNSEREHGRRAGLAGRQPWEDKDACSHHGPGADGQRRKKAEGPFKLLGVRLRHGGRTGCTHPTAIGRYT